MCLQQQGQAWSTRGSKGLREDATWNQDSSSPSCREAQEIQVNAMMAMPSVSQGCYGLGDTGHPCIRPREFIRIESHLFSNGMCIYSDCVVGVQVERWRVLSRNTRWGLWAAKGSWTSERKEGRPNKDRSQEFKQGTSNTPSSPARKDQNLSWCTSLWDFLELFWVISENNCFLWPEKYTLLSSRQ